MTSPAIDLAALRALAEKATPGPWYADDSGFSGRIMSVPEIPGGCRMEPAQVFVAEVRGWGHLQYRADGEQMQVANQQWIAAANPRTVLALLDRLAAAEAVVEAARPWVNFHQVLKGAAQAIDNYDRAIAGQQPRQQEGT